MKPSSLVYTENRVAIRRLMTRSAGATRRGAGAEAVNTVGIVMSEGVNAVFVFWMRSLGRVLLVLSHQYSSTLSVGAGRRVQQNHLIYQGAYN